MGVECMPQVNDQRNMFPPFSWQYVCISLHTRQTSSTRLYLHMFSTSTRNHWLILACIGLTATFRKHSHRVEWPLIYWIHNEFDHKGLLPSGTGEGKVNQGSISRWGMNFLILFYWWLATKSKVNNWTALKWAACYFLQ